MEQSYDGKNVLVMGMKSSGVSAATFLRGLGANVFCYDDSLQAVSGFTCMRKIPDEVAKTIEEVIVSPAIPQTHPEILRFICAGVPIRTELDLGCSFLRCPQIMVTGTNGKTTVVTMIDKLLSLAGIRSKAIGNIGYPVTQTVADDTELDYAVIEVSSFQLEYAHVKPKISVVLNLAPDHLDRYPSYEAYIRTKGRICRYQTSDDYYLFNADDGAARRFVVDTDATAIPIGTRTKDSAVYIKDKYYMFRDETLCAVKCSRLRGEHNKFNLLVALNVGALLGIGKEPMNKLIKEYVSLPNRIEYVTTIGGKSYYNDSKGTNIHACRYAIRTVDGPIGLIMGGSDKNEDFCDFFENIDEKVKVVAVTGGNADKIYSSAMKMGFTEIVVTDTLRQAVEYLSRQERLRSILLSPCCASFDRYKNYAERGEKFKEAVYAIQAR